MELDLSPPPILAAASANPFEREPPGRFESPRWNALAVIDRYDADVDWYRRRYGRSQGEALFRARHQPIDSTTVRHNMLLIGGASNLWQYAIGNGTTTSAQALTYLNSANAHLRVGDSTTGEAQDQTDLQASSNKAAQLVDSGYPLATSSTSGQAITGATNATPIVVTCANSYVEGDFVFVQGVQGNTAANGLWRVVSVSGSGFTLENSAGNGTYTSGGVASKSRVVVFKATFGTGAANFAWNEWGIANAATGGRLFNRKVASLGTKTSAASWEFRAAIGLGDKS